MKKQTPANHEHPGNPCIRSFGTGNRLGRHDKPSPTMVVSGAATSTPLLGNKVPISSGRYASLLEATLPKEAPALCGMRLAEFFCCAGGIGLGFRSAGFELVFANDISERAAESYATNLGHAPIVRDIREVGPADYPKGGADVVTGGFPCVTFSTAGKRAGVVDDVNGKLYLELCRVVREIRPRFFVAENVRGILNANGGAAVKLVLAEFLRLGYRTTYELVNMAEHGVPQTRERVIFVGVRLDQWRGAFRFPSRTHRLREDKKASPLLPVAISLAEAIGDLPSPGTRESDASHAASGKGVAPGHEPAKGGKVVGMLMGDAARKKVTKAELSNYANSGPRRADQPSHPMVSDPRGTGVVIVNGHERNDAPTVPTYNTTKRKAPKSAPSPTIASGNGGGGALNSQPFVVVSGDLRRMTVRECARVQSFPDWYQFAGSQADGYRVIGNAVPPLYARRLALALIEYDRRKVIA